ncbi:kinase-like protein [Basidiobolus meristosporus CBS 931.73]|uniref:non-specific serine/threonine protein kinase n=1 Tax=Basidiobolus meristosporus CBS 931.73 TaxID=1314790 RepID=A0A1Y1XML2_9FUNG|nr:kinase-like protein [Basidiobolus meristosporus CBS 931.73]|eukprot:ORX86935.1 kinase-like protein [Basidiobolus meristosporus CBS 931.73]
MSLKLSPKKDKLASSEPLSPRFKAPKSGTLLIRVVEAKNLSLPSSAKATDKMETWRLPYVVLEFDRNDLLIEALGGEQENPVWKYKANFDVSCESEVTVSMYVRTEDPRKSSGKAILLGSVQITPEFADGRLQDDWFSVKGGEGHIRVQLCYKRIERAKPLSVDDFDLLKLIGKGSFGKVMQVRKIDTNRIYAMKILNKSKIVSRDEVTHTLAERTVLGQIDHPFIVPLKFSFQSPGKLYLILAFVNGGELFLHLQREGRFDETRSRFYAAELLCALDRLHSYNVIYRDLKPENILLDYNGHIALCDFGLCKLNMNQDETTNTFCGTPEYLAPELLYGQGYTKTVDWWTFGVLLYEMLTGLPPFYDENTHEMYRKIIEDELRYPDHVSAHARSLLNGLLERDPAKRLGNKGADEIKSHPFFAEIDWAKLLAKRYQPPFKPNVASAFDTSNFDEEFTSEVPHDSVAEDSRLSETIQQQFAGFTYEGDGALSLAASVGGMGRSIG